MHYKGFMIDVDTKDIHCSCVLGQACNRDKEEGLGPAYFVHLPRLHVHRAHLIEKGQPASSNCKTFQLEIAVSYSGTFLHFQAWKGRVKRGGGEYQFQCFLHCPPDDLLFAPGLNSCTACRQRTHRRGIGCWLPPADSHCFSSDLAASTSSLEAASCV